MSACAGTRSHAGANMLVVVGLVGVVLLAALGSVPMDAPSGHAVARHGTDAQVALNMVQRSGNCQECADGRRRCTASEGATWAVAVYEKVAGTWKVVTSFLCDQDYAVGMMDGCDPRWRGVHP
jgi:hypothetical protein